MTRRHRPWKAMILAAGFGTRLLPYTDRRPKALFKIGGRSLIDRTIDYLIDAGCAGILINTHHLHDQIEAHIAAQTYPLPVLTRYEPQILGTGGAIQNATDFFDGHPFVVINSDIITDIPLANVYAYHLAHTDPVTMVVVDDRRFNTVWVDRTDHIHGFDGKAPPTHRLLTFTGIQILDVDGVARIPKNVFSSSIDTYRHMIQEGQTIRAFVAKNHRWRDIGTPDAYQAESVRHLADQAFTRAFGNAPQEEVRSTRLIGDGSDRGWYRLTSGARTLIMADHGIRAGKRPQEVDAFIDIGRHLKRRQVAVPELIAWERFAGLVIMDDLGDINLQGVIQKTPDAGQIAAAYETVIDQWARLATDGYQGFKSGWTYQTPRYNHELILTKECRYFIDAFVNGYLDLRVEYTAYASEFDHLAEGIMANAINGLIHRDCQSRNIMVKDNHYYFIDFQGARTGPVQYDLASLLIDPYVALSSELQAQLREYGFKRLTKTQSIDQRQFLLGYRYSALSRNLQILGAFAFLTKMKAKPHFESYIPIAVQSLTRVLDAFGQNEFPALKSLADCIKGRIEP